MAEGSLELKPQGWSPRQGSWLGVTGVLVVAGAGAGLLAVFGEHPFWASCLIIAATGYALWFAGANLAGVLLWLPAAVILSAAVGMPSHHDFFPIERLDRVGRVSAVFALGRGVPGSVGQESKALHWKLRRFHARRLYGADLLVPRSHAASVLLPAGGRSRRTADDPRAALPGG